ncbi:hypothetical protein GURASL_19890 [Geotalea uraniireducens]|uniref:Uncharacterized protein n=2 Tax=Geotalea uraniireducens TaxID=351604 RepID=A0ABN6VRX5_9BACT|nr:hypothetical protein GURASL_19890 [Geotalea uraniireducens]
MEWWYDGKLVERRTNVQWLSEGSSSVGWNSFAIGGNSNNTFLPLADQWYAIDDVVISTTPIPQYYKIPNN